MAISLVSSLFRDKLTLYKVEEDSMSRTFGMTGIALRDETLLKADQSGAITYYVEEGKRVKKTGTVFLIDKDGKAQKAFSEEVKALQKNGEDIDSSQLEQKIEEHQNVYSDSYFTETYNLKYDLKNAALNLNEQSLAKVTQAMEAKLGNSFETTRASSSGIATFYSDSFDKKKAKDITEDSFDLDKYHVTNYRSASNVKKGDVVCRITKSEDWQLVVPLDEDQYDELKEKKQVSVRFLQDRIKVTAGITVQKKGKEYFATLEFDDYCIRYINERFLDIEIIMDNYSGLRVPNSALVEKEFYEVPTEYITKGNDSDEQGFSVRETNKDGEVMVNQKDFTIYKQTKKYCYLDPEEVGEDVLLQSMNSKDSYLVQRKKKLKGVYCTNRGYADFKIVDVIVKQEDYSIVDDQTGGGLSLYDFIVEDSDTAEENQIIY